MIAVDEVLWHECMVIANSLIIEEAGMSIPEYIEPMAKVIYNCRIRREGIRKEKSTWRESQNRVG